MCEDNVVEKLMTFNFAGFADEVEECLSFKARNVDPRVRPFYSRILYTWFILRGDYRNGMLLFYVMMSLRFTVRSFPEISHQVP